jgi:hypothetical protein
MYPIPSCSTRHLPQTVRKLKKITLGKLIQRYKRMRIYVNDNGDILLKPVVEIPLD